MSYRTVKRSKPPAFPVAWQLAIPMEEQAEVDERDALSRDIAESPAFSHIVQQLAQAKALGFDPKKPSIIRRAVKAGSESYAEELSRVSHHASFAPLRQRAGSKHPSLVYYMRNQNLVKIGYTTSLKRRKDGVSPDGILVVEPGGRAVEELRHGQFAELHRRGEWFLLKDSLADHVVSLREKFNLEMQMSVEKWLEDFLAPRAPKAPIAKVELPRATVGDHPKLGSLVTAELGALAIGRPVCDVRRWERHGKYPAVARTNKGDLLYRLGDLMAIAKQRRRWHAEGPR